MKKLTKVALLATAMVAFLGLAGCKTQSTDKSKNTNTSTEEEKEKTSEIDKDKTNPINSDNEEEIEDEDDNEPTKLFKSLNCKIDCQIWVIEDTETPTFSLDDTGYATITAINGAGWWGGCFCYDPKDDETTAKTKGQTYDMSEVKKISFKAYADNKKAKINIATKSIGKGSNGKDVTLSQDWAEYTVNVSNTTNDDFSVLRISGGTNTTTNGDSVYIGDITFLDENGNEVIPTCNYTD